MTLFKNKIKMLRILCFVLTILLLSISLFSCTKPSDGVTLSKEQVMAKALKSVCTVSTDTSNGSGFIFKAESDKIYIATNYHVIKGESAAVLRFDDGQKFDGKVIGYNSYHDIAVILIDDLKNSTNFLALDFFLGSIDMGQDAYLIGNALNQGLMAFSGIVSRPVHTLTYTDPLSQSTKRVPVVAITTPINAGSSGSAVFDSKGRVIGVGTYQINSLNGRDVEDMSYAVPSVIVQNIASLIISQNPLGKIEAVESCGVNVKLRILGEDKDALYIDFEGLNFFTVFKDGVLTVTASSEIALAFGQMLKAGDKIIAIGGMAIEGATLFDIFAITGKYIDSSLSENVTDKLLTISYEQNGNIKETGFLNKYEKNH